MGPRTAETRQAEMWGHRTGVRATGTVPGSGFFLSEVVSQLSSFQSKAIISL